MVGRVFSARMKTVADRWGQTAAAGAGDQVAIKVLNKAVCVHKGRAV
jgi:hypothetical protein